MLKKIAALLLVPVLLAGCSAAGDVETLLRAPQLSGESAALQKALNNYLGGSATLKYPASGDFLSPFAFGDWDGDGVDEAAVLYTADTTSSNVWLAVLEPSGESGWRVSQAIEGMSSEVESFSAASLKDVDVTMMLFEPAGEFTDAELTMVKALQKGGPAIAVINKVDLLDNFAALEARKKQVEEFGIFDAIVTVSAKDGTGCEELFPLLKQYANPGPHYFDDDAFTDMPEKELVAEVIREKALLFMRDEIPHGIAVVVERFKERPGTDLVDIDVNIYCERESHKGMVIGKGGAMLKKIASAARADCEEFLGCRVNLQCWVKVKSDWRDNEFLLNNFGFKQNSSNR